MRRGRRDLGVRDLGRPGDDYLSRPITWLGVAEGHFLARDFAGAVAVAEHALKMHPTHWALQRSLAKSLTAAGDLNRALKLLRQSNVVNAGILAALRADIAYLHAVAERPDRSAKFLARIEGISCLLVLSPLDLASIHVALGNYDKAMGHLEDACARRDGCVSDFKQDYSLDPLRSTTRFRNLLGRVGL